MKIQWLLTVLALPFIACAPEHERVNARALEILPLATPVTYEGCVCSLHTGPDLDTPFYAAWELGTEPQETKINLNGQEHVLRLVNESHESLEQPQVHEKAAFTFKGATVDAEVSCQVSQTCWEHESCEIIYYACTITAHQEGRSGSVPVVGACGC
jgi:hypothetical protein